MKKTRYIPYGYTMQNGTTVVEHSEAEVIRRIFESYINGNSLKDIADELTRLKVPYTEKQAYGIKRGLQESLKMRNTSGIGSMLRSSMKKYTKARHNARSREKRIRCGVTPKPSDSCGIV